MNERFQDVERVFHAALELDPGVRAAYLDEACAGDAELRRHVEALLARAGGDTADVRPALDAPEDDPAEGPGERIGRYRLLQKIGEGGFGVVYMAEQEEPVRRKVALKIIKLGMDTKQVVARFEAERQALAMMDHPNIAKVHDGGETETGRPYFVMELVKGVPVTEYCDANNLDTEKRLELFLDVCSAVQHAHQKGVIHRDLKPSNVMVTLHDDRPVAKVIDFGIAKAMHQRLTEKTLFTEYRQFLGTPEYMSPEQAVMSGLDVDTRTDVYALGVLLYELLVGATPFDPSSLRRAAFDELQRIIRETDPPKPSTRLSTLGAALADVARHRSADPSGLGRLLRGDLDWIVMKALEKDRTRRYGSAGDLAQDIRRHLGSEPVLAGPPSASYRLSRFVRRNKVAAVAGMLVAVSLLFGVALSLAGLVHARQRQAMAEEAQAFAQESRERAMLAQEMAEDNAARATQQAARADATVDFIRRMISSVDPSVSPGNDVTVASVLDEATRRLDAGDLAPNPMTEAQVRTTLGKIYLHLHYGDPDVPERHLERAHALWFEMCGASNPSTVRGLLDLAELAEDRDDLVGAERMIREALDDSRLRTKENPGVVRECLTTLGVFLVKRGGDAVEAETLLREALSIARDIHGEEHAEVARRMTDLARALVQEERFEEAEGLLYGALTMQRSLLGKRHADVATSLFHLGELEQARGGVEAAEAHHRAALAMRCELLDVHEDVAKSMGALAHLLVEKGELEEADGLLLEMADGARKWLGDEHPGLGKVLNDLALVQAARGSHADADEFLREAISIHRAALGDDHSVTMQSVANLGALYFETGRYEEAEPLLEEACEWLLADPRGAGKAPAMIDLLVRTYEALGRDDEAAAWRARR